MTGQLHILTTLIPVPTKYKGAKWLHSWSGCSGDDKNLLLVMKFKPFIFHTIGKSQHWLHCPVSWAVHCVMGRHSEIEKLSLSYWLWHPLRNLTN